MKSKSDNFEICLYSSWLSDDKVTIQQSEYSSYRLEIDMDKVDELIHLLLDFRFSYNK